MACLQAARRMMETLQQNVTVNGEPWDPTLRDDGASQ